MFLADLVKRLAHDAEVLLGGEGAAEALGRGAIGHIVQKALAGGADNGDHVGALACSCLGLYHVLIDVTRCHDDVEVGLGALTDGLEVVLAACPTRADACHALVDDGLQGVGNLLGVTGDDLGDVQFVLGDLFGNLLRVQAGLNHGIGDEEQGTLVQHALVFQRLDHHIGQGHIVVVNTVDAHQAAQCALDSHRRVLLHEGLYILGDAFGKTSGILNFFEI